MSNNQPARLTSQSTEVLKQAMLAHGFKPRAQTPSEEHTYAGHPVKDFVAFKNPFDADHDITIWSVNDGHGLVHLFYSNNDDLDHKDLSTDSCGAVIVEEDFKAAARELAFKIQNLPQYTVSSSDPEYYGLY